MEVPSSELCGNALVERTVVQVQVLFCSKVSFSTVLISVL